MYHRRVPQHSTSLPYVKYGHTAHTSAVMRPEWLMCHHHRFTISILAIVAAYLSSSKPPPLSEGFLPVLRPSASARNLLRAAPPPRPRRGIASFLVAGEGSTAGEWQLCPSDAPAADKPVGRQLDASLTSAGKHLLVVRRDVPSKATMTHSRRRLLGEPTHPPPPQSKQSS